MSDDDRIAELERRVSLFEDQFGRLKDLVDPMRDRFTFLCFEARLTSDQEHEILNLMDEVEKSITSGTPMSHHDFEGRVYAIVPTRRGNYGFAESIVSTLNHAGRWTSVYHHYKCNGMNLR